MGRWMARMRRRMMWSRSRLSFQEVPFPGLAEGTRFPRRTAIEFNAAVRLAAELPFLSSGGRGIVIVTDWDHEPRRIPLTRPSGTLSPSGGEGWGEGVRFMGSFLSLLRMHRDHELTFPGREKLRRALIVSSEDAHGRSGLDGVSPYLEVHGERSHSLHHAHPFITSFLLTSCAMTATQSPCCVRQGARIVIR